MRERRGRTDAHRPCELCGKEQLVGSGYVMFVKSTTDYPRFGYKCGHTKDEVKAAICKLIDEVMERG